MPGAGGTLAIHALHDKGVALFDEGAHARHDDQRAFDGAAREQPRSLVQQSPRELGRTTSLWTLDLLAQASFEGSTDPLVTDETVQTTLKGMGITWRRTKHRITSLDTNYTAKKMTRLAESSGPSVG